MKQGTAVRCSISPGSPMGAISPLPPAIILCSFGKWTPEKRQGAFSFWPLSGRRKIHCSLLLRPTPTTPATLVEEKYYTVYCFDRLLMHLSHAVREDPCPSKHGDENAALVAA